MQARHVRQSQMAVGLTRDIMSGSAGGGCSPGFTASSTGARSEEKARRLWITARGERVLPLRKGGQTS